MRKLLFGLLFFSASTLAELPVISNAHIPQPPPGAPVAGGYLTLTNTSNEPLVVTGVSSEDVARIELHLSAIVDDVATMSKVEEVTVPSGESLELKHGSYHLMLMGLQGTLQPGDTIEVTLATSAGPLDISLPVTEAGGQAHKH